MRKIAIAAVCFFLVISVGTISQAQLSTDVAPNGDIEAAGGPDGPAGWFVEWGEGTWAEDHVHSGNRSLKLSKSEQSLTIGWTSETIPVTEEGMQFVLTVWGKLDNVVGGSGAFVNLYHMDENDERIGQSAGTYLGGAGDTPESKPWQPYTVVSSLTPEVKGVRINVRLYRAAGTVWFDDISLKPFIPRPITQARPLRHGLRLSQPGASAIAYGEGGRTQAERISAACAAKGWQIPTLNAHEITLASDPRDLIILGNIATNAASEYLYLQNYSYEDAYFPGGGGYVLRPLIDCLGNGANYLVVGASDDAGLAAGVNALLAEFTNDPSLDIPLTVKTGEGYKGVTMMPWAGNGGRREMAPAVKYLKSGDMKYAEEYRKIMLALADKPMDELLHPDYQLHLIYVTITMSWDLMNACGVFSDAERLKITNRLLEIMRSHQGYGYAGMRPGMRSRENHASRAARAFYYGWRHFNKYYGDNVGGELIMWRNRLKDFWAACLASSRSYEDSLSQHALGGTLDNTLDIAFMEPEWSRDFFASGRARRMGERCIAISNNMGNTVMLGDASASDYSTSIFSKLTWALKDGRYWYMIDKRGTIGTSTDEPLRGFAADIPSLLPENHLGLNVVPADELYFTTALTQTAGVDFAKAFDKLTFRSGFDAQDEYLMIDGTAGGSHSYDDANTYGEFASNGRRWLCEIDHFNGPTMSHHNAVTVARNGLGQPKSPQSAELLTSAEGDDYAYTATHMPRYNGIGWTRHTLWMPGIYTCVIDELTAEKPGSYSFVLGWRSLGTPELRPGLFSASQDEGMKADVLYDADALASSVTSDSGKYFYHNASLGTLLCRSTEVGDFLEMEITVPEAARYDVALETLQYTGRGIVQVSFDGEPLGEPVDMFTSQGVDIAVNVLGTREFTKGTHTVRFEITGRNPLSDDSFMGISSLGLSKTNANNAPKFQPNRFHIAFPANVPATLDRDTETLGKYLPASRFYDNALNILEQSMIRRLGTGDSACFQNAFCATTQPDHDTLEVRRINDHCMLVNHAGEIALIGAGADIVRIAVGEIAVKGRMFHISPSRIILHEAAATIAGVPATPGTPPNPEAIRATLQAVWDKLDASAAQSASPWDGCPSLAPSWSVQLPAHPYSLTVASGNTGARIAAGLENGVVTLWTADGGTFGEFATNGPVHALEAADLDGDGSQEIIVGSDDEYMYALKADLSELWKTQVPFLADEQPYLWWTLQSAKVRRIYADDITGDGVPELLVGPGNMRLHCYDATGNELWRYRTNHGICTTITSADLYGDGRRQVLAGNGLSSSNAACWQLDADGNMTHRYWNEGWCTSLPAIAVGDLDGDGKPTIFCGNNRGNVRAFQVDADENKPDWVHNMTRPIRSLTVIPRTGDAIIAVGSDSGNLCAFNQAGEKVWDLPLSSAITHTALLNADSPLLVAGCKDGQIFLCTPEGEYAGHFNTSARLEDLKVADINGDGTDEIILVTSGPHKLWAITAR